MTAPIRLVVSDIDGTLVDSNKTLTAGAIAAVSTLRDAGIAFALTSSRPPRGLLPFVVPLGIHTPLCGYNGGLISDIVLAPLRDLTIPAEDVHRIVDDLLEHDVSVWVYRGNEWFVTDLNGPHVQREASTVQFEPILVSDFETLTHEIVKIVGVSDHHERVSAATKTVNGRFPHLSASQSQPYYLDITDENANKGAVIDFLSEALHVPHESIAAIGDGHNDVLMFQRAGLSIAMGQAAAEVIGAADEVTLSNDDDGFAHAIRTFVLTPNQSVNRT
jgi:Cof subfamily protein (haloacid dehalogenase superfamily)